MPKQDARYGYHPWIALISLVGAGFILLAYVLWSAYQDVWAEARSVASSQAELLEARFDATLRRVESTLDDMAVRVPAEAFRPGSVERFRPAIEAELERARHAFPEVFGFRIIDADGWLLYRSGGGRSEHL
jgi:hypothetical protein